MKQRLKNLCKIIFISFTLVLGFSPSFSADNDRSLRKAGKNEKRKWQTFQKQLFNKLSKEDRGKLKELQKENPEAFRKEIKALVKKYRGKHSKGKQNKEIGEMVNKYHSAEGEDKEQILLKIKEKVTKQFNNKMEANKRNIKKTEKRLNELKIQLQKREDNADEIIEARVKALTQDPSLRW